MPNAQSRALQNYRTRLGERGLARFEVRGRDTDRDLIRTLARKISRKWSESLLFLKKKKQKDFYPLVTSR